MNMPRCLAVASCLTLPRLTGSPRLAKMTPCRRVSHACSLVAHLSPTDTVSGSFLALKR